MTDRLLIESERAPAGTTTVYAPYDRSPIVEVAVGGPQHVDDALSVAAATYADRDGWLPLHERVAILRRTAELMEAEKEELAVQAAREGGKPLIDSRAEVARAIDGIHLCVEVIRNDHGEVVPMGGTSAGAKRIALTQREPIGPVVAVSAFNHPLNLIVHQVATAVAAGCPVIVKPAESTPLSCIRFVELLREAGLPGPWCQMLLTDTHDTAEALVTDPRVAFFTFIGSAKVGWMLRSKLAPGTRCAFEHGGVAPLFIAADADLDAAVPAAAKGGFYHAGQVCVSVQRVFAHKDIARAFAERLAEAANAQTIGDPTSDETEVGPLIRPDEVTRVKAWVDEAMEAGAERLSGGDPISETCYPCTVLFDPPADAKVSTQEIFGPVVCVYPYDELDAAIEQANALPYAFQAAVFTKDMDTALRIYRRVAAAAVMVGDHTAFRVDGMPFGGLRESGLGTGGIGFTIADMQVEKLLVIKSEEL